MEHSWPSIRIAVAAHKPYWMPDDPMYVPVQAGAIGKETIEGYQRDDEGDGGISALNPHLSELTVLYWAWKHLEAESIGLSHYRRQFAGSGKRGVLTHEQAEELLKKSPVVVPKSRNYMIETVGAHFDHTHGSETLDLLLQVVADRSPNSIPALYRKLSDTRMHMFNMFIMRRDLLDAYCSWMFPIVCEIEKRVDYSTASSYEARMPGRLSEFLLDTWLETESIAYAECPLHDMDPVNWVQKGGSFMAAKFLGKEYTASF